MKEADKSRFALLMAKLATAHRMKAGDDEFSTLMGLYWEDLKDLSMSDLEAGALRARMEIDWFPKISELRRLAIEESRKRGKARELPASEEASISREEALSFIRKINAMLEEQRGRPMTAEVRRARLEERKKILRGQAERLKAGS
jgi:hypothetical protein